MKLLRVTGDSFVFHLSRREKRLFFSLLELYPVLQRGHYRASTSSDPKLQDSQELLAEAMEEVRDKHRRQVDLILHDQRWLKQTGGGHQCALSTHQIDWLLQVLNDIRVGSWTRLGCPDEYERRSLGLNKDTLRHLGALELSGYFQDILLHALDQRTPTEG